MDLLPIWRRRWEVQRRCSRDRDEPVRHHVEREAERERKAWAGARMGAEGEGTASAPPTGEAVTMPVAA